MGQALIVEATVRHPLTPRNGELVVSQQCVQSSTSCEVRFRGAAGRNRCSALSVSGSSPVILSICAVDGEQCSRRRPGVGCRRCTSGG